MSIHINDELKKLEVTDNSKNKNNSKYTKCGY